MSRRTSFSSSEEAVRPQATARPSRSGCCDQLPPQRTEMQALNATKPSGEETRDGAGMAGARAVTQASQPSLARPVDGEGHKDATDLSRHETAMRPVEMRDPHA